jgi:molybdopterin/thiamine biosynthesis adenylyltransferase
VGTFKAKILAHTLYRAVGTEVEALSTELTPANVRKLLTGSALVVDAFDNSHSRRAGTDYCTAAASPCLHVGLAAGYAEVIWNERYRVPSDAHDDLCDYPLARTLVLLAVAVAAETIVQFVACGSREDRTITLADLTVGQFL